MIGVMRRKRKRKREKGGKKEEQGTHDCQLEGEEEEEQRLEKANERKYSVCVGIGEGFSERRVWWLGDCGVSRVCRSGGRGD